MIYRALSFSLILLTTDMISLQGGLKSVLSIQVKVCKLIEPITNQWTEMIEYDNFIG